MRAALLAIVISTTAYAQSPDANAHARRGVALYNLGKYDDAIVAFEEAYTLFQSDALLFNLAQAHRQLGHCELALGYYKRFMAGTPAPALAAQVETLLPKLEAACSTKFERPAGPVSTPEPAPPEVAAAPTPEASVLEDAPPPPAASGPRIRAIAALTAGSVISNKTAPSAGVKVGLATPLPWFASAEVGITAAAAKLFRAEGDRDATLSSVAIAARLSSDRSWARLTIGGEVGGIHISSLDTSSGVIPGVRRAGLWAPLARVEAGAERSLADAFAVRVAVAAAVTPRSGPMLESMTQVDVVVGVRYER